ncbi:molybdopterin-dependent oxidoreductase [Tropicibacter oceani]|uniref:Molybdopterin-dependent oxidoreductase n=1 Tax=Tropicibacter oceani TaxID=3058420 RepID=A0ABY8QHQ2_9RHOB|nr:molybdopterin-dependent oxidoreductase [Tropicibacter oceani]WGW03526.1 molybdopterin-dependent oxidoreductase [Tropicibacter oceani]
MMLPTALLKLTALSAICLAGLATGVRANSPLPVPQGPVVLRVHGHVPVTNVGDEALFDLQMLRDLPRATIRTRTIWTVGEQEFSGLWLKTLVERLGIEEGSLDASALNEYIIEIPLWDAVDEGALIAYEIDGRAMSVRDKGPLWVVYPYDANSDYRSEVYYARSIWQLDTIEVLQ